MNGTRNAILRTQHALSEPEIEALIDRCPEEYRWAFSGWLRGERELNGDPIEPQVLSDESWTSAP